jgi:hypothetical protein
MAPRAGTTDRAAQLQRRQTIMNELARVIQKITRLEKQIASLEQRIAATAESKQQAA